MGARGRRLVCILELARGVTPLRPFISYFGGKWRAAPAYPAPRHARIVEPFAGSAGYSLRYWNRAVTLVEKYEPLAAVWQYLISVGPAEILALPILQVGERVCDVPRLTQEQRWLIGYWCNAGAAAPRQTMLQMRDTDGYHRRYKSWGEGVRARIAQQVSCIRHWRVIHGDFSEAPNVQATWFVDPPYQGLGRFYPCGDRGIDFEQLGAWCRTRRGQILVCEAEGARWLPFQPFGKFKRNEHGGRGNPLAREALWRNDAAA